MPRWSLLWPLAARAQIQQGDRGLPFFPSIRVLDDADPCFDVLLGTGKWMGNDAWFKQTEVLAAQEKIEHLFGISRDLQQFLALSTDTIVQTMRSVTRRAFVLPATAARSLELALRVLEGMRQLLRLERYGRQCVDDGLEVAAQLCSYVEGDIKEAACFGVPDLCGDCPVFAQRPKQLAQAVWNFIDRLPAGAPGVLSWAPVPRYPAEYSHGICGGPVDASAFEGQGLHSLDPLGFPSPHLSLPQILWRLQAAGVNLSFQLVNLGANDGTCREGVFEHDPANCLLRSGSWGGVLLEGDEEQVEHLRRGPLGHREDVHIFQAVLGIDNTSHILRQALEATGLGADIDLLKIDIDLCDDLVLRSALATPLRPKVIHVEVQLIFPPDVIYRPRVDEHYRYGDAVLPAVSSLAAYLAASEYVLLHIEPPNVLLLRPDVASLFPTVHRGVWAAWRDHYFCRADLPVLATNGLYKFGDFDFAAFLEGTHTNRKVVEAFVRRSSESLPPGMHYDLYFSDSIGGLA